MEETESSEAEQLGDFFEEIGVPEEVHEIEEVAKTSEPEEARAPIPPPPRPEAQKDAAREAYARRQADSKLKAENEQLRQQMSQYQAYLQQQQQQQRRPQAPEKPPEVEEEEVPDLDDDPEGYIKYEFARIRKENEAIKARIAAEDNHRARMSQAQQEQQSRMRFLAEINQAEKEWESEHEGYRDRFGKNVASINDFWLEVGLSKQEAQALVQSEMEGIAHIAKQKGIHPGFIMDMWHQRFIGGAKKLSPTASNAAMQAARAAYSSGDSRSLSATRGGNAPVSVDRVRREGFQKGEAESIIDSQGIDTYFEYMKRAGA